MKKTLISLLVLFAVFSAFAGNWSFEPINAQDLYTESSYDQYAFKTQLGLVYFLDKTQVPPSMRLLVAEKDDPSNVEYIDVPLADCEKPLFLRGKFATDIGLAHVSFDNGKFPKIEGQFSVKAYFNLFIYGSGGNAVQGFDGSYFLGPEFKFADRLSFRAGLHHLSGHYGDEAIEKTLENISSATKSTQTTIKYDGKEYIYYGTTQYVRDNELLLSAAYDLPLGFRPYFQFATALNNAWIRPFIHTPDGQKYTVQRIVWGEGLPEKYENTVAGKEIALKEGTFYHAFRINTGFDWKMRFNTIGIAAGADFEFNQDGMSGHKPNTFSKDNPWEFEYTLGTSFELYNAIGSKTLNIDFTFHDGRPPMLNYYYIHTKMLYVGFGIH